MTAKAGYSTPLLHVTDVARSIRFYEQLGFVTVDTDRQNPIGWARMHCDGGALMFLRAEKAIDVSAQAVLFYMYTPQLTQLREQLAGAGLKVGPIKHPDYMRSGEIRLDDPDGYVILVGHWGESEQEAWDKRVSSNR
jgi:catechol 2,3-dioxygenase-like lactoylglutathione lyase family enzyme